MPRVLAPYLAVAIAVVVVSVAILTGALASGGLLVQRTVPEPVASPSASRTVAELPRAGRIAYWRPDASGATLWVAGLDGSQRRALATIDLLSRVSATRWSPDGNAIAYLDRAQGAAVVRLDGTRIEIPLPPPITQSGSRLIDLEWSTDGRSLAATLRATTGLGAADVYVAAASGGTWGKVTEATGGFLSQWISADELLIQTQEGMIALVRSDGSGLRPLTGLPGTSPFLADDGRIYFLAGQIAPTIRDSSVPVINAAQSRVWSVALDGAEPRQETDQPVDDVRLAGRWPNGRFLVHQGASTAIALLAPLETLGGVVDRVVFSPDRRTAIGVNAARIFRYDVTQPAQPVLLLSDVAQPDAWYPQTTSSAASSPAPVRRAPEARYAFAMHGIVWVMDASGAVRFVRRLQADAQSLRRLGGLPVPQWSPRGDRLLYFDVLANTVQGAVFSTDLNGAATRLGDLQDSAGPFPKWSPDGNIAYGQLIGTRDAASFGADSEVRLVTTANARVATLRGREVAFGGGKTYLIDNGRLSLSPQTRIEHAILEQTGTSARTVTSASFVNAGLPFNGQTASPATPLQLSQLESSSDGAFLSVRVSPANSGQGFTFALLSATDGTSTLRLPGQTVADVRWAPTGHLVGLTLGGVVRVIDAQAGVIAAAVSDGRFAGWSPDGTWFYVARDTGLYATPLAGGEAVRVSPFGVAVSTATP